MSASISDKKEASLSRDVAILLREHLPDRTIVEDALWLRIGMENLDPLLRSGWKLHLSATLQSYPELLARALPILAACPYPFKLLRSAELVEELNDGCFGLSQIGKTLTIYPPSESAAATLAARIAEALRGLPGPQIPTDARYDRHAPVYYRFGPYDGVFRLDGLARRQRVLWHPDFGEVIDPAEGGNLPPPRPQQLPAREPYDHLDFLRDRYLFLKILQVSAKGSALLAMDPAAPGRGRLFIKTAKAHTHCDTHGRDAIWALRREQRLLKRLADMPGIPEAGRLETADGVAAIVRPYYDGKTFWELWTQPGMAAPEKRRTMAMQLRKVLDIVTGLHRRGIVLRDLSPMNILIEQETVRLLDLELAHDLATQEAPFRRGTPGFYDPRLPRDAAPTFAADHYALLALAWMLHTGTHPAWWSEGLAPGQAANLRTLLSTEVAAAWDAAWIHFGDPVAFPDACDALFQTSAKEDPTPPTAADSIALVRAIMTHAEVSSALLDSATPDPDQLNVYSGLSGLLLCAAECDPDGLSQRLDTRRVRRMTAQLQEAAAYAAHLPGLYFGASGYALACIVLGKLAHDRAAALAGDRILDHLRACASSTPDLTHGWAGYIHAALAAHRIAKEPRYLHWAVAAGNRLLHSSLADSGGLLWQWPEGPFGTLAKARCFGFAHGSAGIAHALYALYACTREERFVRAADKAIHRLHLAAEAVPGIPGAICWPCSTADSAVWNAWCHGAPGIVRALCAAIETRPSTADSVLLVRAVRGMLTMNAAHYCLCHGLASRLEALIAAQPHLDPDEALLARRVAAQDAAVLHSIGLPALLERERAPRRPAAHLGEDSGLMTGAAGAIRTLLRYGGHLEGPYARLLP